VNACVALQTEDSSVIIAIRLFDTAVFIASNIERKKKEESPLLLDES